MRTSSDASVIRELNTVFQDGRLGSWGDDRLLDRFAERGAAHSELAFAALVERHGPRVYRVCRAVTGDGHAAEDVFQATFLVLARKAGKLRVGESLGPWLHGVATRLASSARCSEATRKRHEEKASHREEPSSLDPSRDEELNRLLLREIGRLPVPYREAVYLCDVEGLDMPSAARQLDCAVGTIKSRLSRGRKRLRSRLLSRGIVPGALTITTVSMASASVPRALAESTVRSAVAITAGGAAFGMVPAGVVALFEEGMSIMLWTKIRVLAGAVVIGLTATMAAVVAQDGPGASRRSAYSIRSDSGVDRGAADRAFKAFNSSTPFEGRSADWRGTTDSRPSDSEVLLELMKRKFHDVTIQIEQVTERVEPWQPGPGTTPTDKVTVQFKATVKYTTGDADRVPHTEVLYIDKSYARPVANPKDVAGDVRPNPGENRRPADNVRRELTVPDRDSERRLDEVERKLDRILKALEKTVPDDERNTRRDFRGIRDTVDENQQRDEAVSPVSPDAPKKP